MSEHDEQAALFQWAALRRAVEPRLALLFAIPNGGLRNDVVAAKLRAEGVQAGVPDLCLPVPAHGYHGLFIEMKFGRNTLTAEQAEWIERLAEQGYRVEACWAWDDAARCICEHLGLEAPEVE